MVRASPVTTVLEGDRTPYMIWLPPETASDNANATMVPQSAVASGNVIVLVLSNVLPVRCNVIAWRA
jgi:hypothetical protein